MAVPLAVVRFPHSRVGDVSQCKRMSNAPCFGCVGQAREFQDDDGLARDVWVLMLFPKGKNKRLGRLMFLVKQVQGGDGENEG